MKNSIANILLSIFVAIVTVNSIIYANNTSNVDKVNLYIVKDIPNFKNCVVNENSEIVYTSLHQETIDIISDEYTKDAVLIKLDRTEKNKTNRTIDDENDDTYFYSDTINRYLYYDAKGNLIDMKDDNISIGIVYNNYAIANINDDYQKGIAKIFDLKSKKYIKNNENLTMIMYENNTLFGKKPVSKGNKKTYKYYLLNDDLSVKKEITSDEYEDLNGKVYEKEVHARDIIFVTKHNLTYILNENYESLSEGYDCETIGKANFYEKNPIRDKYDYKDIIFYRIKDNQITYFTLDRDIYTKTINDKHVDGYAYNDLYKDNRIYKRRYSIDEDFVVGENNCYAMIDKNKAFVYSLETNTMIATVSSIVDYTNNEEVALIDRHIFYIDDIYVYDGYVMCRYYDNISKRFIDFTNVDDGYGASVLNKDSINLVTPKRFVLKRVNETFHSVVDADIGTVKILYSNYIDMKVYEHEGKYIIALQKAYTIDDDSKVYDLYDKDYNLLYANVMGIEQTLDLFSFESYKIQKPMKTYNDNKLYSVYRTIVNFDNEVLFESDIREKNGIRYSLGYFGIKHNISTIIVGHYKDGKKEYEELLDKNKKELIDIKGITRHFYSEYEEYTILSVHTQDETYIYRIQEGKLIFIKKLSGVYYQESVSNLDDILSSNKLPIIMVFYNHLDGLYTIFDNDFNIIGEKYKNIWFERDYYYYRKGFKIYICDYSNDEKAVISLFNSLEDE